MRAFRFVVVMGLLAACEDGVRPTPVTSLPPASPPPAAPPRPAPAPPPAATA